MLSRWLAADARARAHRCKAKQRRRGKTALKFVSYFHSSTVFGRRREGKGISLVTMTARCFFIMVIADVAGFPHSIFASGT